MRSSPANAPRSTPAAAITFLLLGAYTLIVQVVVLRECFLLLSGNELSVALLVGLWLCLTSAGSAVGSRLPARAAGWLLVCLPAGGLWAVTLMRLLPVVLPIPTGQEIPIPWAVLSLALALIPVNLVAGALFPTACRLLAPWDESSAIGRFYMFEAVGAAVAGAFFTFLLAGRMPGLTLAVWLSALAAAAGAVVLWRRAPAARTAALAVCLLLIGVGVLAHPAAALDELWWRKLHRGSQRVLSLETRYQRIDVGLREGEHTIYANADPVFAPEDTDEATTGYRSADLYLALHPDPRRVLILGSGEHGLPGRILEYPDIRVTYALLDPALLNVARAVLGQRAGEWDQERLTVVPTDGRRYVQETDESFDLILYDLPPPSTSAGNRFFTVQAFRGARRRLRPGGLLIVPLPSSPHYIAGETVMFLSAVHRALKQEFVQVNVLAGESMVFIAGLRGALPSAGALAERFAARPAAVKLASGRTLTEHDEKRSFFMAFFGPQFDEFRLAQQLGELQAAEAPPNDDGRPIAYYLNLRRWVRQIGLSSRTAAGAFGAAEKAAAFVETHWMPLTLAAAILALGLPLLLASAAAPAAQAMRRGALAAAVLASGGAGMLGELALVFTYQNSFGQIYSAIGALFATYMLALAAGSALSAHWRTSPRGRRRWLLANRGLMALSCAAAIGLSPAASAPALFAALFVYAFALGMDYPLATRIYREDMEGRRAAGILYSMDSLGAAMATFAGGTLLLPLVGPRSALVGIACVHLVVLSGLLAALIIIPRMHRGSTCSPPSSTCSPP